MIHQQEQSTYEDIWTGVDAYTSEETIKPGLTYLPIFLELAGPMRPRRLLDVGCGDGQAGLAYQKEGFLVTLTDITDAGLIEEARALPFYQGAAWRGLRPAARHLPEPWFDYVTCTDVMEHLPTQFTMLAVRHMLDVARMGVFLSIALTPDVMGAWIGKRLHQTVQPFTWWRDSLSELCTVKEARDLITVGLFWLHP